MFDREVWSRAFDPHMYGFWALTFFTFGALVGSFLNVCIHRMPRGLSIVSPPSHCPHCHYSIPWFLNIPLVTWLYLKGKCAHCHAPISARYFLVELLTALAFLASWVAFSGSPAVALVHCILLAGFIAATFIDFEHFIIPDEITLGGIGAGFVCSIVVPRLHETASIAIAMKESFLGIVVGGGLIYAILRLGKLLFGRQRLQLGAETTVYFTETAIEMPGHSIPYEELFYRKSDAVVAHARRLEMVDRCYANVPVRLTPESLAIGEETFNPAEIAHLELLTDQVTLPREAMGFGDVKFMAAIGAFLGWQSVIFSLMVSSIIGAVVGVTLIALRRQEWSSRLPYGPYIALAATLWIFGGKGLFAAWFAR